VPVASIISLLKALQEQITKAHGFLSMERMKEASQVTTKTPHRI
jgi:hypothetical protein